MRQIIAPIPFLSRHAPARFHACDNIGVPLARPRALRPATGFRVGTKKLPIELKVSQSEPFFISMTS